jgi:hypothetical protein
MTQKTSTLKLLQVYDSKRKNDQIFSVCRDHSPVLFSFMTCHRISNNSSITGATSGASTAYPPNAHDFIPDFVWGSHSSIFFFCVVFYGSKFFTFALFCLSIVLSVHLRITASDYSSGNLKLFLTNFFLLFF